MNILFLLLSILLALIALGSSSLDFRGDPRVTELVYRLQFRPGFEKTLGIIKVLGAVGLLVGLFLHPIGIAAAIGFVLYFALAIRAHFKIADPVKEAVGAFALFILSVMTAIVGLLS